MSHFGGNRGTWQAFNKRFAGKEGSPDSLGYLHFGVFWRDRTMRLKAHRVACALYTGRTDFKKIDHADQTRTDNRKADLREATSSRNMANRGKLKTTGLPKGVSYVRRGNLFQATAKAGGKTVHLGLFRRPAAAHAAYCRFGREAHGEFFNPGAPVESVFD